jgi:hypothetical protein
MHAHVQRLVSVVKMTTVFEGCTTEEQRSVLRFFLWAKGRTAKDIHKKMFPVYGGKCFLHKAVHNWVWKRGKHSLMTKSSNGGAEMAETTVKRLLCCRFQCNGKAMGQVHQCWCRICQEINVFSRFEYHVSCFTSICDLFTNSPS